MEGLIEVGGREKTKGRRGQCTDDGKEGKVHFQQMGRLLSCSREGWGGHRWTEKAEAAQHLSEKENNTPPPNPLVISPERTTREDLLVAEKRLFLSRCCCISSPSPSFAKFNSSDGAGRQKHVINYFFPPVLSASDVIWALKSCSFCCPFHFLFVVCSVDRQITWEQTNVSGARCVGDKWHEAESVPAQPFFCVCVCVCVCEG